MNFIHNQKISADAISSCAKWNAIRSMKSTSVNALIGSLLFFWFVGSLTFKITPKVAQASMRWYMGWGSMVLWLKYRTDSVFTQPCHFIPDKQLSVRRVFSSNWNLSAALSVLTQTCGQLGLSSSSCFLDTRPSTRLNTFYISSFLKLQCECQCWMFRRRRRRPQPQSYDAT